ncbi:hypothetical protein GCM10009624_03170 [Gordonia sinesedis]
MTVPVIVPAWIIGDGAVPFPADGEQISYAVAFTPVLSEEGSETIVSSTVVATPTAGDGDKRTVLHFPSFDAVTRLDEPAEGTIEVRGELSVEYEMFVSTVRRLRGTVTRRRMMTELRRNDVRDRPTLEFTDVRVPRVGFDTNMFGSMTIDGNGLRMAPPTPPDDGVWRRDAGLLLDIRLD